MTDFPSFILPAALEAVLSINVLSGTYLSKCSVLTSWKLVALTSEIFCASDSTVFVLLREVRHQCRSLGLNHFF